jgi:hypothetical protein
VLCHEISACTWDLECKAVTSPRAQTEMTAIAEFEQQDWVQQPMQGNAVQGTTKQHVDLNVAFPFQDNISVCTIHGANANKAVTPTVNELVEIQANNDDVSVLTAKTVGGTQLEVVVGSRVASGSNPVSGPTANFTQSETTSGGSEEPASIGPAGGATGRPNGK